jgi:hypothetical protein
VGPDAPLLLLLLLVAFVLLLLVVLEPDAPGEGEDFSGLPSL